MPRCRPVLSIAAPALCGLLATTGVAAATHAPTPVRPVSAEVYSGRWYEIARTPNRTQKDCQAPVTEFQKLAGGDFIASETCHRGAPDGPVKVMRARARIISPGDNTRFRMSFLGGLIHQEYWVLDHAGDDSWLIMGTPGGNYVWLLARRPALSPAALASATARVTAMGYAAARLIFPGQASNG